MVAKPIEANFLNRCNFKRVSDKPILRKRVNYYTLDGLSICVCIDFNFVIARD